MEWVKFPWSDVQKGQGFFVPCLDFKKVRMLGMRAALPYRIDVHTIQGVYKGQLGILFIRVR